MIGIPLHGDGKEAFWSSLQQLIFATAKGGVDTAVMKRKSPYLAHNRNIIVRQARNWPGATHLLFLDADMEVPSDTLLRLLAADKDMVVANAYLKSEQTKPLVDVLDKTDNFMSIHIPPEDGQLHRVHRAGTGVCLFKLHIFDTIPFPWFFQDYSDPPKNWPGKEEDLIEGKIMVGEDTRFFMVALGLGFKLYCDFSIEIGHIGDKVYTWKDYEAQHEEDKT